MSCIIDDQSHRVKRMKFDTIADLENPPAIDLFQPDNRDFFFENFLSQFCEDTGSWPVERSGLGITEIPKAETPKDSTIENTPVRPSANNTSTASLPDLKAATSISPTVNPSSLLIQSQSYDLSTSRAPLGAPSRINDPPPAEGQSLSGLHQFIPDPIDQQSLAKELVAFGVPNCLRFKRPPDGEVNSFVKFRWTKEAREVARPHIEEPPERSPNSASQPLVCDFELSLPESTTSMHISSQSTANTISAPSSVSSFASSSDFKRKCSFPESPTELLLSGESFSSSFTSCYSTTNTPSSPIPPYFKAPTAMQQKFDYFYKNNWCPGRGLSGTINLWQYFLNNNTEGVQAAIHSVVGTYIYDYQPHERILKYTHECLFKAVSRLICLRNGRNLDESSIIEFLIITYVLATRDVNLVRDRLKNPDTLHWFQLYTEAEKPLTNMYQGERVRVDNTNRPNSHKSRCVPLGVIIGYGLILAQPMMALPDPETMDPTTESARFEWLCYGTAEDLYEIHGGCGFSKRVLLSLSQITYCAARLQQAQETIAVPKSAEFLEEDLKTLRQWNRREGNSWEAAKKQDQPISWIKQLPDGFLVNTASDMIEVTAEAWRIAALLYLQCRLLRLPRHHKDVIANLGDLKKCIAIMPTSGSNFTAQAPIFPVFLLALLSTTPDYKKVAIDWFQSVAEAPVRSNVPLLLEALKLISEQIGSGGGSIPTTKLPEKISDRAAWWEDIVSKAKNLGYEILCLIT